MQRHFEKTLRNADGMPKRATNWTSLYTEGEEVLRTRRERDTELTTQDPIRTMDLSPTQIDKVTEGDESYRDYQSSAFSACFLSLLSVLLC